MRASDAFWGGKRNIEGMHTSSVPCHEYLFESLPVKWSTFPEFMAQSVIERVNLPSWNFVRCILAGNLVYRG